MQRAGDGRFLIELFFEFLRFFRKFRGQKLLRSLSCALVPHRPSPGELSYTRSNSKSLVFLECVDANLEREVTMARSGHGVPCPYDLGEFASGRASARSKMAPLNIKVSAK